MDEATDFASKKLDENVEKVHGYITDPHATFKVNVVLLSDDDSTTCTECSLCIKLCRVIGCNIK